MIYSCRIGKFLQPTSIYNSKIGKLKRLMYNRKSAKSHMADLGNLSLVIVRNKRKVHKYTFYSSVIGFRRVSLTFFIFDDFQENTDNLNSMRTPNSKALEIKPDSNSFQSILCVSLMLQNKRNITLLLFSQLLINYVLKNLLFSIFRQRNMSSDSVLMAFICLY